ncbi:MAG TPA: hypothetical protein VL137_11595 [Polyangiaceae bacterium]|nr:hypothetical protein [Polyangiaceae bacterium]
MKTRPSVEKRRKEKARQDKNLDKLQKREQRKVEKAQRKAESSATGIDPDIAHIVPGPQPLPPEFESDPIRRR